MAGGRAVITRTTPLRVRLLSRLIIAPSGCLLWQGRKNNGYGAIKVNGQSQYVHRVMYEMFVAAIPQGLTIDHLCRVRHCANPAHLEPVTMRENIMRSEGPAAVNASKIHCPQGHEYTPENTLVKRGKRHCRACVREDDRQRKAAKRATATPKPPKTHCVHGHEYTPENTITHKNGHHECRECRKGWNRACYQQRRQRAA